MEHGIGQFTPGALERAGVDQTVVDLSNAFLAVMDRMRQLVEQVAAEHDLNIPTALTLRMLDEPLAQREIAEASDCDPSYVTAMVDRLESLGAVERQPDPDDRRVKRVVLTDHGRQLREQVGIDLLSGVVFKRSLDADERAQLLELLTRALATEDDGRPTDDRDEGEAVDAA